jgi:hypothetical protein
LFLFFFFFQQSFSPFSMLLSPPDVVGRWSKLSNVEEDTRVPLVVAAPPHVLPWRRRGLRTSALVELVDLFPTLVHLATGHDPSAEEVGQARGSPPRPQLQRLEGSSFRRVLVGAYTRAPGGAATPTRAAAAAGGWGAMREDSRLRGVEGGAWKRAAFSQVVAPKGVFDALARTSQHCWVVVQVWRSFGGGGKEKLNMMGYSMRTERFRLTVWASSWFCRVLSSVNFHTLIFFATVQVDCGSALKVDMSVRPMRIALDPDFSLNNRRLSAPVVATELFDLWLDPLEVRERPFSCVALLYFTP